MLAESNRRGIKIGIVVTLVCALLVVAGTNASAQTLVNVTLAWNPSAASDVAGYYLYQGTGSGVYTNRIDVGNATNATISGLTLGVTYYSAVSAYDSIGLESLLSNEILYSPGALNVTYYGISLNDPSQALADSDRDGLTNLLEYAVGCNPLNSTDADAGIHPFITQVGTNAYLALQYKWRTNSAAAQLLVLPEVSADRITWYSDCNHVLGISVTPLDAEFNWVSVQDAIPISPAAGRFIRLRVVLGNLESTSPVWMGSDTLLHGNKLTFFSQRTIRPILCAGTVTSLSSSELGDTNTPFVAGQFGTNGTPAYVEFDNGTKIDIAQTTTDSLSLASNPSPKATVGDVYRIRAQSTVASLFGTNNEAGLKAGPSPADADSIMLFHAQSQITLTLFYYSDPMRTAWQGWVRADLMAADANEVVDPEQGIVVHRILPNDLDLYICGPIKTGLSRVQVQPGYNLLGTLNNSGGVTLANLGLYRGSPSPGLIGGMNPNSSDNVLLLNPDGSLTTFFYYYQPGVFQGWVEANGFATSDDVLIPSGSAFFLKRQAPTSFTWTISTE